MLELVKRNIFSRYKNTLGGFAWSIVQPLFMLLVYVIAFGYILQIRWPGSEGALEYAFALFAGLIIYNAFSEVLNNSAIVITSNPNFVKKVVFPLEMLPIVTVFTALLHAILSLLVWVFAYTFLIGFPEYTVLLFPVVFLVYFPILLGIAWLASAFGVLIRDSAQFATILGHALLFLSPVFYSIEQTPESIQRILVFNPLTFVIEQLR
ncbi:MAG: ABC transporter permease, partial [Ekhidna sp.]